MNNIHVTDFDSSSLTLRYEYVGKGSQEIVVQFCWRGAVIYRHKAVFEENPGIVFWSCINEGRDYIDKLEVVFLGADWKETYTFDTGKKSFLIDYDSLPHVENHPKDLSFPTYEEIFVSKIYESKFAPIEQGDAVVDIGGNNGFFALFASQKNAGKIICYEPSKHTYQYLRKNTQDIDGIRCYMKAVEDKCGKMKFIENYNVLGSAGAHVYKEDDKRSYSSDNNLIYEVETVSMEEVFKDNDLTKIDYLKIDCEGSELSILRSINPERFRKINKICVEAHSEEISKGIREILDQMNFDYEIKKGGWLDVFYAKNRDYEKKKKIVLIGSFCDDKEKEDVLLMNVKIIKDLGIDVLVYSPLDLKNPDISKEADFYFKTKENPLLLWPQRAYTHWLEIVNKNGEKLTLHRGLPDYGWAGLYQVKKMSEIALTYDYDTFIHMIYDVEIDEVLKKEILDDEVNFLHPRRDFHNPGGVWDATLHFMVFDRKMMQTIANSIQLRKYTDSNGMAEHHALGWVYDHGIAISAHPVADKIYYWQDRDIFNYSKSSSYKIFWSKNQDTDPELKVVFSDFDESTNIKLVVNGIEYTNIENWVYISTRINSADLTSLLVHHEGEFIDYTDDYVKTMRNLIYYA